MNVKEDGYRKRMNLGQDGNALIQLGDIQPELSGALVDVGGAQRGAVPQQTVMHLP